MISYFKYTNGESFTLNGNDYTGVFNVVDGKAYTSDIFSSEAQELVSKDNFLSELYLERAEFDRTAASTYQLESTNITPRDILTQTTVQRILSSLDNNNKTLVKTSVIKNPSIARFSGLPSNDKTAKFYGLSSTEIDIHIPKDTLVGKRAYTQIDPFSYSDKWGFLDNVVSSSLLVRNDYSFTYFVTTSSSSYALSGNINSNDELILLDTPNFIPESNIDQNGNLNILYEITPGQINIYDLATYYDCGTKILVDSLVVLDPQLYQLKDNNTQNVRIGKNLRASLVVNNNKPTDIALDIRNAYSNEQYFLVPVKALDLTDIIAFDVRSQDDAIIILGVVNGFRTLMLVDTSLLSGSTKESGEIPAVVYNNQLLYADNVTKVTLSPQDSNVCYFYERNDIQARFISNPRVPCSILDSDNFLFLQDFYFNTTNINFNDTFLKFNSNKLKSNSPNLLTTNITSNDNGVYAAIHFIGRLYILDITNTGTTTLLPTITKYNKNIAQCSNTYLGAVLNKSLYNIVSDTLNIYNNYTRQVRSNTINGIPLLIDNFRQETPFKLNLVDFYVHENESNNILSVQRITRQITELQTRIISQLFTTDLILETQLPTTLELPPVSVDVVPDTVVDVVPPEVEVEPPLIVIGTPATPPSLSPPFRRTIGRVIEEINPPPCLRAIISATAVSPQGDKKFVYETTGRYYNEIGGWLLYNGNDPRALVFGQGRDLININNAGAIILRWNSSATVPLFGDLRKSISNRQNTQVNGMWELLNTSTPLSWGTGSKGDENLYKLLVDPTNRWVEGQEPLWRPPFTNLQHRDIEGIPQKGLQFYATRYTNDEVIAKDWHLTLGDNNPNTSVVNKELYYCKLGRGITLNSDNPQDLGIMDVYTRLNIPRQLNEIVSTPEKASAILYGPPTNLEKYDPRENWKFYINYKMSIVEC